MPTSTIASIVLSSALLVTQSPLSGAWRAVLESPGGPLPFELELERRDGRWAAHVRNGEERIEVPEVSAEDGSLILDFPHYDSRIEAAVADEGAELAGSWRKRTGADTWAQLAFRATHVPKDRSLPRFEPLPPAEPSASIEGRWAVRFASSEDPAVAIFRTDADGTSEGTFLTTTGDYRYLAGSFEAGRLRLSTFDGAHAFLFDARLHADGTLSGDFWSRDSWHEEWSARRDPEAALSDAMSATAWTERASLGDLMLPDLNGNPRSLADPAFAGRARILQVFGSWCPNCHDASELLVELDREYRERGLSIVGLAFELTGDFERDARQVRRYAERHGIAYPLLVAGLADKDEASAAFPLLDRVRAYPTTVLLHGDGRVAAIHTGFAGPATGAEHEALRKEIERVVEELLAEEPPDASALQAHLSAQEWRLWPSGTPPEPEEVVVRFARSEDGRFEAHWSGAGEGDAGFEMTLAAEIHGDVVSMQGSLWRWDERAGVLSSPLDFASRLAPRGGSPTPIVAELAGAAFPTDDQLLPWFSHEDPIVRREALYALGLSRPADADGFPPAARPAIDDPDLGVRVAAAWAAGRRREGRLLGKLIELTEHPYATLRREATRALGRIAGLQPGVREVLQERTQDPDPLVRKAAHAALQG